MSLWGNNDNINSPGTVTLNYGNNVVTGSGTSFGLEGEAQVGDVIRFGQAIPGGPFNYFGDAVITEIESTTKLTIQDTAGLSGREIVGKNYQISQSPKYLPNDAAQNESSDAVQQVNILLTTQNTARVAVAATVITVTDDLVAANVGVGTRVKMFATPTRFQYGTVSEVVGTSTAILANGVPQTDMFFDANGAVGVTTVGVSTVVVKRSATKPDDPVSDIQVGDAFVSGSNSGLTVAAIGAGTGSGGKSLTLSGLLSQAIDDGQEVVISRGLAPNSDLTFASVDDLVPGGKESFVMGVAEPGTEAANNTIYKLTAAGWVGVTTYLQDDGELRVKTETFVAMSGIATGNTPWPPV